MTFNLKNRLNNIINSGFDFNENEMLQELRYRILNISLIFAILSAVIGITYDIFLDTLILIYAEIFMLVFLLYNIYILRTNRSDYEHITTFLTLIVIIFFDSLILFSRPEEIKFSWIIVYAAVFIFYKGNKSGWKWICIFVISILLSKLQPYIDSSFSWVQISYFLFVTLILTTIISFFQYTIEQTYTIILEHKQTLMNFNQELGEIIENKLIEIREKDHILFQQSKMAAMGEMIGNIAHQWRQPLNTISVVANRMSIQKELSILDDKSYKEGIESINMAVQHLSQTINDFRNYFKHDKRKEEFNIRASISHDIHLVEPSYNSIGIKIISDLHDCLLYSYKTELSQVIINIMNNAKDALENCSDQDKYIFINSRTTEEKLIITIKDNAKGIDEKIILKIFEPYFTTKHKDQGTGIGLFMTEEIVVKHLEGTITVKNVDYSFEGKLYKGAQFDIILPLEERQDQPR